MGWKNGWQTDFESSRMLSLAMCSEIVDCTPFGGSFNPMLELFLNKSFE